MKIDILTLFPEMFEATLGGSILGRAQEKGILDIKLTNIRDYSKDKHNKADDYPFGGGAGMLMLAQPIFDCLEAIGVTGGAPEKKPSRHVIYMSPRGRVLDQSRIRELASEQDLVILCGHYEGIDQRCIDYFGMEEISIGDYVLTGGELAAMVLVDSVARLVPGVLSGEDSAMGESIYSGLLEYPQYTKPREFRGMEVPEVLTGGNHKLIELWKYEQSLALTKERRPDLFEEYVQNTAAPDKDHKKILERYLNSDKMKVCASGIKDEKE